MNDTSRRLSRPVRALAYATTAVLAVGGLSFASTAASPQSATAVEAEPALDWGNYEKVLLTKDIGEPIDLTILPDGRLLHTARNGDVRLTDPTTGVTTLVNQIPVYANSEDGLQSLEVDPNFEENDWVYLVYAPIDAEATAPPTRRPGPRRTLCRPVPTRPTGTSGSASTASPASSGTATSSTSPPSRRSSTSRRSAASAATSVPTSTSTHDGNLYLTTGDNTPASTPGANGFAPNNDAPGMNPGLRRTSRRGQHQRPARQDPPDPRRGRRLVHDPRGQPVRRRDREDATRDLRHGRAQPVPHRRRRRDQHASRGATTDRTPASLSPIPRAVARWVSSSGTS